MQTSSNRNISIRKFYADLLRLCRPILDKDNIILLRKSVELAKDILEQKGKLSDKNFFNYTISVSKILTQELNLGISSVIAGILHNIKIDDINQGDNIAGLFGKEVEEIIKGLTKISKINTKNTVIQSDNFIKLIVSLSDDIRVVLVQIAGRLAFMRSFGQIVINNPVDLAMESEYLYAPLAHRLGLYKIKTELEDISMKILHPELYKNIAKKLNETKEIRNKYISEFIQPLNKELKKNGIVCEIKGRPKSISSIWAKMNRQSVEFEEVYDLFAIRIIPKTINLNEKAVCWNVYSIVTDLYKPNPNRLRDWISAPKPNGYESLHTTVLGQEKRWVEVQVRTKRMDEIAEIGYAAHWKYKNGNSISKSDGFLSKIREALDRPEDNGIDVGRNSKMELYTNEVFIFTPLQELKKLPANSSVLDFAFSIHGDVGASCSGGKVNGKMVPIKHKLQTGDTVEIFTSKNQFPKSDWLNYVVTRKASSRIKRLLKDREYKLAKVGKELLLRKFAQWKPESSADIIHKVVNALKLKDSLELYQLAGEGKISIPEIRKIVFEEVKAPSLLHDNLIPDSAEDIITRTITETKDYIVIDDNIDRVDFKLSKCCNPIFGDRVFGFVTIGRGTKIHRINCPNANDMMRRYPYRVVKVKWTDTSAKTSYPVNINVTGKDDIGILNYITKVISDELNMKVRSIKIDSKDGMFEGYLIVMVNDTGHLDQLIKKLTKVKGVMKASRMDDY